LPNLFSTRLRPLREFSLRLNLQNANCIIDRSRRLKKLSSLLRAPGSRGSVYVKTLNMPSFKAEQQCCIILWPNHRDK
jgi:hypothetical protein